MSHAVQKFLPYLARYRGRFTIGSVFLVLATAIQLLSPWVLKHAIDDLTVGVTRAKLGVYATLLIGIALVGGVCRFLMRRVIIGASREIEYDLRNDFFAHLQRLPLAYFQSHRTGDLMSRATNDLSAVRMMAGPAIMYSSTTVIVLVVSVALMLSISPWLTLFVLVPLPLVSVAVKGFGSAIYRRSEQIQAQLAQMSAIAHEALAGVRVVRAYGREAVELRRFQEANQEYVDRSRAVIQLQGLFYPSLALFLGLSALVVLWLGTREVTAGRMTVGDFVAFNAYLVMLTWPMIAFGWVTNMLQRGMAAWKRMLDVLEAEPSIQDPGSDGTRTSPADIQGRVEFRDLSFAYDGRPVLEHVSAVVEPGQMLALVGPTGSGKSTLVDLLPRLFDPPEGTVFIDDVDVRRLPLPVLRGAIGYVPQEPLLFSDTIAANVAFGALGDRGADTAEFGQRRIPGGDVAPRSHVHDVIPRRAVPEGRPAALGSARDVHHGLVGDDGVGRAVAEAAAVARLDTEVEGFLEGFETPVGERGITLSGGQKQRVAIARALMVNPRILILDDALSAVDTHTEEEILTRLRVIMRQRTSIVVSHRISTVRHADLILVLDGGRVVERGTHATLLAHDGLYAGLYRKQLLERELEES